MWIIKNFKCSKCGYRLMTQPSLYLPSQQQGSRTSEIKMSDSDEMVIQKAEIRKMDSW